jgi:hypothetical protein
MSEKEKLRNKVYYSFENSAFESLNELEDNREKLNTTYDEFSNTNSVSEKANESQIVLVKKSNANNLNELNKDFHNTTQLSDINLNDMTILDFNSNSKSTLELTGDSDDLAKKTDAKSKASLSVPKRVILSWTNLTIKAEMKSITEKILYYTKLGKRKKRYEVILNNIRGVVEPGEMLALMGPR